MMRYLLSDLFFMKCSPNASVSVSFTFSIALSKSYKEPNPFIRGMMVLKHAKKLP